MLHYRHNGTTEGDRGAGGSSGGRGGMGVAIRG